MSRGSIPKDPGLLYGAPPKRPRKPRLQRTEQTDGTIIWRVGGGLHREGAPAVRNPAGCLEWWRFGVRHRENGPAVEWADGRREWWLEGEQVSVAEWSWRTWRGIGEPREHDFLPHGGCLRCGVKIDEGGTGAIGCEAGVHGNDLAYVGFARTALEQDLQITLQEKMEGIIGDSDDLSVAEFRGRAQKWNAKVRDRALVAAAL